MSPIPTALTSSSLSSQPAPRTKSTAPMTPSIEAVPFNRLADYVSSTTCSSSPAEPAEPAWNINSVVLRALTHEVELLTRVGHAHSHNVLRYYGLNFQCGAIVGVHTEPFSLTLFGALQSGYERSTRLDVVLPAVRSGLIYLHSLGYTYTPNLHCTVLTSRGWCLCDVGKCVAYALDEVDFGHFLNDTLAKFGAKVWLDRVGMMRNSDEPAYPDTGSASSSNLWIDAMAGSDPKEGLDEPELRLGSGSLGDDSGWSLSAPGVKAEGEDRNGKESKVIRNKHVSRGKDQLDEQERAEQGQAEEEEAPNWMNSVMDRVGLYVAALEDSAVQQRQQRQLFQQGERRISRRKEVQPLIPAWWR